MPRFVAFVRVSALALVLGGVARPECFAGRGRPVHDRRVQQRDRGYHTYRHSVAPGHSQGGTPGLLRGAQDRHLGRRRHRPPDASQRRRRTHLGADDARPRGRWDATDYDRQPVPVVDSTTGTIWLTFCRNNDDVLVTSSTGRRPDLGRARMITGAVKKPGWALVRDRARRGHPAGAGGRTPAGW